MKNFPITKINDYVWEIPPGVKPCQKVPVRIYADSALLEKMKADLTIEQGINVGCLPGVYKYSIILPDGPQLSHRQHSHTHSSHKYFPFS